MRVRAVVHVTSKVFFTFDPDKVEGQTYEDKAEMAFREGHHLLRGAEYEEDFVIADCEGYWNADTGNDID